MCCNYRPKSKLNHKAIEKFFKFISQSFNDSKFVVNDDKRAKDAILPRASDHKVNREEVEANLERSQHRSNQEDEGENREMCMRNYGREINEKENRNKMLFKEIARTRFVMNFSHTTTMNARKKHVKSKLI